MAGKLTFESCRTWKRPEMEVSLVFLLHFAFVGCASFLTVNLREEAFWVLLLQVVVLNCATSLCQRRLESIK